jgi:hypothetical protein
MGHPVTPAARLHEGRVLGVDGGRDQRGDPVRGVLGGSAPADDDRTVALEGGGDRFGGRRGARRRAFQQRLDQRGLGGDHLLHHPRRA